jgi:hypothetical protein
MSISISKRGGSHVMEGREKELRKKKKKKKEKEKEEIPKTPFKVGGCFYIISTVIIR